MTTDKEKRRILATYRGYNHTSGDFDIPDYFNDYNAVADIEHSLTAKQLIKYADHLTDGLAYDDDYYCRRKEHGDRIYSLNSYCVGGIAITPINIRVNALGKTLGLWE